MHLTQKALNEFKAIYKEEFGEDISDDETLKMGTSLINLFKTFHDIALNCAYKGDPEMLDMITNGELTIVSSKIGKPIYKKFTMVSLVNSLYFDNTMKLHAHH